MADTEVKAQSKGGGKGFFTVVLIVLLVITGGAAAYFYTQLQTLRENPQADVQQEVEDLLAEIGELILLPENEQPTIATVSDVERLQDQAFFANAKNGDRVLIYTEARKAILYDPVAKKIIEVAPVNIGEAVPVEEESQPDESGELEEIPTPEQ